MSEKTHNGKSTEAPEQQQITLNTGYHPEANMPLVILGLGQFQAALAPDAARNLAVQIIGAALVAEQEAIKRHQPLLQQATAAAMEAVKRH